MMLFCHNIKMTREATSADTVAAKNFFTALQMYIYMCVFSVCRFVHLHTFK
jgi:hypothetical protein